jgi:hypothetical protein
MLIVQQLEWIRYEPTEADWERCEQSKRDAADRDARVAKAQREQYGVAAEGQTADLGVWLAAVAALGAMHLREEENARSRDARERKRRSRDPMTARNPSVYVRQVLAAQTRRSARVRPTTRLRAGRAPRRARRVAGVRAGPASSDGPAPAPEIDIAAPSGAGGST